MLNQFGDAGRVRAVCSSACNHGMKRNTHALRECRYFRTELKVETLPA